MQAGSEGLLARLRKILALAGNNPSPEEAEAAILKAQEMMARHGLTEEDLEAESEDGIYEVTILKSGGKRPFWWRMALVDCLAGNFRCEALIVTRGGKFELMVFGLKSDIAVVREVCNHALKACAVQAHDYVRGRTTRWHFWTKELSRRVRLDFIRGWIWGLHSKLQSNVTSMGCELVLAKPQVLRDFIERMEVPVVGADELPDHVSEHAVQCGVGAGASFSLGEPISDGPERLREGLEGGVEGADDGPSSPPS